MKKITFWKFFIRWSYTVQQQQQQQNKKKEKIRKILILW